MVASVLLRIRILIAAALLLPAVAATRNAASTQSTADTDAQKTETSDLVIRQNVRRVVVDVVVSDSSGKPVSGLNARDFSVNEDGKSQRIRSFDVHDFDSTADSLPKRPTSLPTNTFVNLQLVLSEDLSMFCCWICLTWRSTISRLHGNNY